MKFCQKCNTDTAPSFLSQRYHKLTHSANVCENCSSSRKVQTPKQTAVVCENQTALKLCVCVEPFLFLLHQSGAVVSGWKPHLGHPSWSGQPALPQLPGPLRQPHPKRPPTAHQVTTATHHCLRSTVRLCKSWTVRLWSLSLPRLHSLRSLSLHNNLLTYLPREILSLVHLQELSLRGNPLVVRFVKEMIYDPPSLLELAGRTVKSRNIPYSPCDLPSNLLLYLDLASKCPNPKCAGKTMRNVDYVEYILFLSWPFLFPACFCSLSDIWVHDIIWMYKQCSIIVMYMQRNNTAHHPTTWTWLYFSLSTFLQAFTSTHVCARLSLWTSVESTGCPSCTTCALLSAPLPAAPTPRATPSRRTRAVCRPTACRGCFWDSTTRKENLLALSPPKPSLFSPSLCSALMQTWTWLSDFSSHERTTRPHCFIQPLKHTTCKRVVLTTVAVKISFFFFSERIPFPLASYVAPFNMWRDFLAT